MGMFDYVNAPDMPCPECGGTISGWQSKSGPCELLTLDYTEVDHFYSSCGKEVDSTKDGGYEECGYWMGFTKEVPDPDVALVGYEQYGHKASWK